VVVEDKLWTGRWALPSSAFGPDVVGAKAMNVEALRGKLPPWIGLPTSAAIPYGTFEEVKLFHLNFVTWHACMFHME
jgi:alpha-glucan,water dikinase